jgi:competence protein ComEC
VPPIAVVPALALLTGAILGARVPIPPAARWLLPLILLAAVLAWRRSQVRLLLCLVGSGCLLASALLAEQALHHALESPLRAVLDQRYGHFRLHALSRGATPEPIATRFELVEDAAIIDDGVAMPVAVTAVRIDGTWQRIPGDLVRLTVSGAIAAPRLATWRAGRTATAPVTFRRPARYFNEGVGDFERGLVSSGTILYGSIKSGYLVDVETSGSAFEEAAAAVRAHVRTAVSRHVGSRDPMAAAIVTAILIGDRTGLPDEVRLRLQAAGTYHIIAISGGNIALLAGVMLALLPLFLVRGRAAALVTIMALATYAAIVTAGPSVWRATVMAIVYLGARALDQRTPPWQAMAVACIALVVTSPLSVADPGFLLTFGATGALLEGAPRLYGFAHRHLTRLLPPPGGTSTHRLLTSSLGWVVASVLASVAVEIVLLPVGGVSFSRVTAAGVVLNLIAVPLMAVVQVAGVVIAGAASIDAVASVAGTAARLAASGILESARLVDATPWLAPRVPAPGSALVITYYVALGLTLVSRIRRVAAILVVVVAGGMVGGVPVHTGRTEDASAREVRLTMLDVGQGESTLLEVPGAEPLLIDAAGAPFGSSGDRIGARVIAPALWRRGVRRLGALLVTHGDPDHIGGAASVANDFRPRRLWTGVAVPAHEPGQLLLAAAGDAGAVSTELRRGAEWTWGRARIRVLHPPPPDWERQQVRNDDSVVLEVVFGDVALLLTGDISTAVEAEIVPRLSPAATRILKVAHHGSRTSSSSLLLDTWRPQIALISCGRGNRFGHPTIEVLDRLRSVGARVYRTDLDGQITLETDGERVRVRTYMEGRHQR